MKIPICFRALLITSAALIPALGRAADAPPEPKSLSAIQEQAARFNSIIELPHFETTPTEVAKSAADAIASANQGLDKIGAQDVSKATFDSTVGALDTVVWPVTNVMDRLTLVAVTSPDKTVREAAEEALKNLQTWAVGVDYREDVYRVVSAYAKTDPKLTGEDARLLEFAVRDYRRAGLDVPPNQRATVEKLRQQLATQAIEFASNVVAATAPVTFSRAELDGVPDDFLADKKTADGQYKIMANVTPQYTVVMDNAKNEDTRHRLYVARDSVAADKNVPLFNQMLAERNDIALKLGYKSWDDYQTEVKMVKDGHTAEEFIDKLIAGTEPKFQRELAEMEKLKSADYQAAGKVMRGPPRVMVWDGRYYTNQILKTRFQIDTEAMRVYFPFQKVLEGMFRIYSQDFGLNFTPVAAPFKWVPDLQLYVASDATSGEPLGLFYLDMFPRPGKYNHFAEFGIVDGKLLPDGKYQRPVVCLVCNFPPPGADGKPALMSHDDVTTIFHEFGHALHAMVTRAKYGRFAGTNVPGDFVEAPSQMLENWTWDKDVLDSFAADYRDPQKKVPQETLGKMKEARLATAGIYYRRQFAFAKLDLVLHAPHPADQPYDCVGVSNDILNTVSLPIDFKTATIGSFTHLADGYDAGYYGYAWAESIAADMAMVFRQAPGGFMDHAAGMRLRTQIYEPGNSRDVADSIQAFLGRPRSIEPFLANNLGLTPNPSRAATPPANGEPAGTVK